MKVISVLLGVVVICILISKGMETAKWRYEEIRRHWKVARRSALGHFKSMEYSQFGVTSTTMVYFEKGQVAQPERMEGFSTEDLYESVQYVNSMTGDETTVLHRIGDADEEPLRW